MKRISLMILLAICVTIGGVYASWNYAEVATAVKTNTETSIKVTDPITNVTRGTIDTHNTLSLVIDDNDGDRKPEWDDMVTDANGGSFIINFTPNSGANPGADGVIKIKYTFTVTDATYDSKNIFTYAAIDGEASNVFLTGTFDCTVNGGVQTATVLYTDVIAKLSVNNDIHLPTFKTYEDYVDAVNSSAISITVEEVEVNQ